VRPERHPTLGFHTLPGKPQNLGDRGLEVVVTDLATRHPAEHPERVFVTFEEGLLPT
jgi:hypothetical protein